MTKFNVTGMNCAACSARVERAVSSLEGVSVCSVSLLSNSMTVEGDVSPESVISAVKAAGYGASLFASDSAFGDNDEKAKKEERRLIARLCSSAIFSLLLMYVSMGHSMLGLSLPSFLEDSPVAIAVFQALLSGAVLVINRCFFISGIKAAFHLAPNMDTLVSLGSGVSYLYSTALLAVMISGGSADHLHGLYYESAAMILTLITVGKLLEARSKGKTANALRSLAALTVKTAIVIRDGIEYTIDASELEVGDLFIVKAGDASPADGIIVEGAGALDESALTGESIPADKQAGDAIFASTINVNGYLVCKATHVGADTTLSQIIKTVEDASASKAPIAKIADKVSGVFVPIVISISVITAIVWLACQADVGFALSRAISVVVISCPCALGLATPVAITVGCGKGAREGILFKNATALEEAGKTKIVAIDKTGTLTYGKPVVTDVITSDGSNGERLVSLAYSLEKKSEHPLSLAIVEYAQNSKAPEVEVRDARIFAGSGISGEIDNGTLRGGNMRFIGDFAEIDDATKSIADSLSKEGKTPLFFSLEEKLLGLIAVADEIKAESKLAVDELHKMGIKVVMLTGDNENTARAVSDKIGIRHVSAGILPNKKADTIIELQKEGKVLMVGDGINDAPALATADTGMAIGAGTQIAIESADVVLINSSPLDVVSAIRLSRQTLRIIKQNLFWAFVYNAIGIPLAAGVFIPFLGWTLDPMFGAAAMSLSSFCVITNALRLNLAVLRHENAPEEVSDTHNMLVLNISGMMCSHCEARVKGALESLENVEHATADHKNGKATVTLSGDIDHTDIKTALSKQGYTLKSIKRKK